MPDLLQPMLPASLMNQFGGGAGPGTSLNSSGAPNIFQPNLFPSSYSGVNPSILTALAPMLSQQLQSAPNSINSFMRTSAPSVLTDIFNNLGANRMMNSSVASDALSKGVQGLGATAMHQQMQMPAMLSQVAQQFGGMSYSSNPLAPYELMNQFVLNY